MWFQKHFRWKIVLRSEEKKSWHHTFRTLVVTAAKSESTVNMEFFLRVFVCVRACIKFLISFSYAVLMWSIALILQAVLSHNEWHFLFLNVMKWGHKSDVESKRTRNELRNLVFWIFPWYCWYQLYVVYVLLSSIEFVI